MLISEKTTGSIYLFIYFSVKRSVSDSLTIRKNSGQKVQAKVVKCAKNKSWVHRNNPVTYMLNNDELSVKGVNFINYTLSRQCCWKMARYDGKRSRWGESSFIIGIWWERNENILWLSISRKSAVFSSFSYEKMMKMSITRSMDYSRTSCDWHSYHFYMMKLWENHSFEKTP